MVTNILPSTVINTFVFASPGLLESFAVTRCSSPATFSALLGVSRMKRIDSFFQCCIEDGSWPTAYVVQTKYANHLKVLCSKGTVLNVQAKGSVKRSQVRVKKLNESEPTEDMSKRLLVVKSTDFQQSVRQTAAVICLPAAEQPALRRQELYTGFYTKRERLTC